jgi:yecA family protein
MNDSEQTSDDFLGEEMPDSQFDWLANIYNRHGAINHPSELHGLMLGEIVGNLKRTSADWLQQVYDHMGVEALDEDRYANATEDLLRFYQETINMIDKDSSSFTLLLPDDDYELSERVDSLVLWVRGFLEGIAISASERLQKLDKELQEILRDFVEICQIDSRVEQDETSEKEFVEILEYVRIGVLNLYAELHHPGDVSKTGDEPVPPLSGSPTLH